MSATAAGPGRTPGGSVRVTSEIGELETVLCHAPGPELNVVTPDGLEDFLFDDLLDPGRAREQHDTFTALLGEFAEVLELADLLEEVLRIPEARESILGRTDLPFQHRARERSPERLARVLVEGEVSYGGELARLVNEAGYSLPPLPNLFFTRDAAAVIGGQVVVAAMRHRVRWTEEVIVRTVFAHHPDLANDGILYDGTDERRTNTSLEGGDVHLLREDLLMVGLSERTTAAGIDALADALAERTGVRDVLVVILPPHRTSIHLDMIFTMIDHELCCVFPPYFQGPTRLPVLHLRTGETGTRERQDLFSALRDLGLPLTPVRCGGEGRVFQEREQWSSGCNLFAVGPGQLIAYDRSERTLRGLEEEGGFRLVSAGDLLSGEETVEDDDRFVITFDGSELMRGGGGPRCMTLPVRRRPLA